MGAQTKITLPLFGIEVKKKLVELNMTQRELADEIGANENYLTDILRGRRSGVKYIDAIVKRLDLKIDSEIYLGKVI